MIMRHKFEFGLASLGRGEGCRIEPGAGLALGLGISTACNGDCVFCYYHAGSGKQENATHMPLELAEIIFANLGKLALVNIALQGEPFMHPEIFAFLALASRHAENVAVCTNALLLDKATLRSLQAFASLKLAISLDACDERTYMAMRKRNFQTVLANARQAGVFLPGRVELNFMLCRQNMKSLGRLPDFMSELGICQANLALLRETDFTRENGLEVIPFKEAALFAETLGEECRKKGTCLAFEGAIPANGCNLPFVHAAILADGSLFPCCGDFQPAAVEAHDFEGIFNHPYLRRLRNALLAGARLPACAKCMPWLFNQTVGG